MKDGEWTEPSEPSLDGAQPSSTQDSVSDELSEPSLTRPERRPRSSSKVLWENLPEQPPMRRSGTHYSWTPPEELRRQAALANTNTKKAMRARLLPHNRPRSDEPESDGSSNARARVCSHLVLPHHVT